jgi:Phage tail lysozyme
VTSELTLGATGRDLIQGDPDELDRLAARLAVLADGMGESGRKLADVHAAGWTGPAADTFRGLTGEQPAKHHLAAAAFQDAVAAIRGYASVLRQAQADAGGAASQFTEASARSQAWQRTHTSHEAIVRAAAAAGRPAPVGPAPPPHDPAAADLVASHRLVADARAAVHAQGRAAAAALAVAADGAPDRPALLASLPTSVGDLISGTQRILTPVWHATGAALEDVDGWLKSWEDFAHDLLKVAVAALLHLLDLQQRDPTPKVPAKTPPAAHVDTQSLAGRIDVAYHYFRKQGLTRAQAAGLVGNLQFESGGQLDPAQNQYGGGPGRGIGQWTYNQRWLTYEAFAKGLHKPLTDYATQVAFVWHELQQGGYGLDDLKQATTVTDATTTVMNEYERPNRALEHLDSRLACAQAVYDRFDD